MQTRINPKNGDKLSALTFGFMRLHRQEPARELVRHAIEQGVNFFDTAYIYPGNEALLGRILASMPGAREKINIATKLPPYLVKKTADFARIFEAQLARLQTGYVDYYMMHMLMSAREWDRLVGLGVIEWLEGEKKKGRIRNIGFSSHASTEEFIGLCDAYPWEFCMVQYNYADRYNQAGEKGLRHAHALGMPVIAMEPLRGGSLANNLPPAARELFAQHPAGRSPAEWALRWLWNQPEVTVVLSGMKSMAVLEENLRVAESALPGHLSAEELETIERVRALFLESVRIPCTACGYCLPCPQGVDIINCFEQYNQMNGKKGPAKLADYIIRTNRHNAGLCNACGKCETRCPQSIAIGEEMKRVQTEVESGLYRPLRFVIGRFMKWQ